MKIHERDPGFMIGHKTVLTIAEEYIDSALSFYAIHHNNEKGPGVKPVLLAHAEHKCGFICTGAGLYAVAALVKNHRGDKESSNRYLNIIQSHFLRACHSPHTSSELFYGRAGYLYTELFISGILGHSKEPSVSTNVSQVFDAIIEDGKRTSEKYSTYYRCKVPDDKNNNHVNPKIPPLLWTFEGQPYLGASHGLAGILTILLQFPHDCKQYEPSIENTINYVLFETRRPNGNWPVVLSFENKSDGDGGEDLVQFCHGASGIIFLACKAYEVYKDKKYLDMAIEIGEYVHKHGITKKGGGLCHGVSGNVYTFLSLYLVTKNQKYLDWVLEFAKICTEWEERVKTGEFNAPDHPFSLWEGLGGAAWLIADLLYWENEVFKGFPGLSDV